MDLEITISKDSDSNYWFRKLGDQKAEQWLNFQLIEIYEVWKLSEEGEISYFQAYCSEIANNTATFKIIEIPQRKELEN